MEQSLETIHVSGRVWWTQKKDEVCIRGCEGGTVEKQVLEGNVEIQEVVGDAVAGTPLRGDTLTRGTGWSGWSEALPPAA